MIEEAGMSDAPLLIIEAGRSADCRCQPTRSEARGPGAAAKRSAGCGPSLARGEIRDPALGGRVIFGKYRPG